MKAIECPTFTKLLQACFILHYDLLRFPRTKKPFVVQIVLANEPHDFQDFVRIFTHQSLGNGTIKGMVQLNAFDPYFPTDAAAITGTKRFLWELKRDSLLEKDHAGLSIGIVQVILNEKLQVSALPIVIDKPALEFVRTTPSLKFTCPVRKVMREVPLTIESCMEYLNALIRADVNNEMGLHTEMRPYDIKVVRDANGPRAQSDSLATLILRGKMAREEIYRPLISWTTAHYPRARPVPEVGKPE